MLTCFITKKYVCWHFLDRMPLNGHATFLLSCLQCGSICQDWSHSCGFSLTSEFCHKPDQNSAKMGAGTCCLSCHSTHVKIIYNLICLFISALNIKLPKAFWPRAANETNWKQLSLALPSRSEKWLHWLILRSIFMKIHLHKWPGLTVWTFAKWQKLACKTSFP